MISNRNLKCKTNLSLYLNSFYTAKYSPLLATGGSC